MQSHPQKPTVTTTDIPQTNKQKSMVDLHGMSSEDSAALVNKRLAIAEQANIDSFRFVTGRGNHVNNSGERGKLFREFESWLSQDNLKKIASIKKNDGYYEIKMLPTANSATLAAGFEQLTREWLMSNIKLLEASAIKGDADSQYLLGHCYQYGVGVKINEKLAVEYYEKANSKNNIFAQYALGCCYWVGCGCRQNDEHAIALFNKAASQKYPPAYHQLGDIYHYGYGVAPDLAKAKNYYQLASDAGIDIATRKLAHCYYFGKGAAKDLPKAQALYKSLADKNDAHAAYNVACAYFNGEGVPENMSLAFKYAKHSADLGDPDGQFFTSIFYMNGVGVEKDKNLGLQYLEKAAANNHKEALFECAYRQVQPSLRNSYLLKAAQANHIVAQAQLLAMSDAEHFSAAERQNIHKLFWQQDDGTLLAIEHPYFKLIVLQAYFFSQDLTKKQKAKVNRLLNALAKEKYPTAFLLLGSSAHTGRFVKQDSKQAEQYWIQGANLNEPSCACSLGYLYEEKADYKKAFEYYAKAAALGDANSCNQLGLLYKKGKGVKQDISKAIECFKRAFDLDVAEKCQLQRGVIFQPVFPHAALNLALCYGIHQDNKQMLHWLFIAAEAGHEQAIMLRSKLLASAMQANAAKNPMGFWQQPQSVKETPLDLLKQISALLNLKSQWTMSDNGTVHCLLNTSELTNLQKSIVKPLKIVENKQGQYFLLLEKMNIEGLKAILNQLSVQKQIAGLTI